MTAQNTHLEKKRATIVCADIHGIFRPREDESIDQSAGLMNTCNDIIESVTSYYGGKVIQFTGKSTILSFEENSGEKGKPGNPLAAAIEIREKIIELSKEVSLEVPLELQAGIRFGPILLGHIGTAANKQLTVIGETVDIAAKIRDMANKGQILAGKETYDQNKSRFDFQTLEPVYVKGKSEPIPIYKVLNPKKKEFAPKAQSGRSIYSEMIGRKKEKEKVIVKLISLTKGEGGIINIVGAPGTGKSRLIEEIKKERIVDQLLWFEGRGLSHGHTLSYHPLAGIIKSWAGILEEDSPMIAETKLKNEIKKISPEVVDSIFPFVARFMGLSLSGDAVKLFAEIDPGALDKMMLKALRELLIKATTRRPFIIAIEDLHWADQSSLSMLKSLYQLARSYTILFINIMRPGYEETTEPLLKSIELDFAADSETIKITNLDTGQSTKLINNLILSSRLPATFLQALISKTDGNPFFIEEVLRSLIDQGIIEYANKTFVVNEKINSINIPETIHEVLLSRVEKLDEKTRNLLDTASVIGRNFYFKVLDEAADTIGEVSERLQYLKNMQIIQESCDQDNLEFVFKHALAHQASYDAMVDKERKSLHLKIAESIEKVFPERINEFYGTLAMHYSKAENYQKAEEFLLKAGDEAYSSAASMEAIEFYQEAFRVYLKNSGDEPDPEKLTVFYERIANAHQLGGKNEEAIEYYEKVLKHYGKLAPQSKNKLLANPMLKIPFLLITVYFPGTQFKKQATGLDKRLLKMLYFYSRALYSHDSKRWFLHSLYMFRYFSRFSFSSNEISQSILAAISIMFNWTGISLSIAEKILEISGRNLDQASQAIRFEHALYSKMHQFLEGDWKEDQNMEVFYTKAMKRGDAFNLTPYLLFCVFITIELGLEQETYEIIDKMKKVAEEFENDHSEAQYHRIRAVADFKFRKVEHTDEVASKGIEFTKKTGHQAMLQVIYSIRTMNSVLLDKLDFAKSDLSEVEKLMPQQKRIKIWHSTYLLAKAYLLTEELRRNPEDTDFKNALLRTCRSAIKQSAMVPNNLIESHRICANALWMIGKKKKSIKHYLKSIEAAKKVNGRLELSRTYFDLGKRMLSNGSIPNVNKLTGNDYLEKARQLFSAMNLTYDLEELERFLNK